MATGLDAIVVGTPIDATGGVSRAPLGTVGPTDATTALPAGFKKVGRISEDGLTENYSVETEKVKDWSGKTVKVLKTDSELTYEFTILEVADPDNLGFVFGDDNVTTGGTAGTVAVDIKGEMLPAQAFAFTMREGSTGPARRIVVPHGQPTMSSEVTYISSDVVKYTITVDALADDNGVLATVYLADGTTEVITP